MGEPNCGREAELMRSRAAIRSRLPFRPRSGVARRQEDRVPRGRGVEVCRKAEGAGSERRRWSRSPCDASSFRGLVDSTRFCGVEADLDDSSTRRTEGTKFKARSDRWAGEQRETTAENYAG